MYIWDGCFFGHVCFSLLLLQETEPKSIKLFEFRRDVTLTDHLVCQSVRSCVRYKLVSKFLLKVLEQSKCKQNLS